MSNVQVLHIEKRMTIAAGLDRHITRVQWVDGHLAVWVPCNADPDRTKDNVELVSREFADSEGRKRTLSLQQAVTRRIKEAGIKPRKDQNRCLEIIFSGSPEVMCNMSREEILAWANDTLKWAQKTWGKENVVSASLHVDEKTPHIHMIVVPIVKGESRRTKKQKDIDKERGITRASYNIDHDKLRLCCNEVYATPKLYAYHDNYAVKVSNKYGLERGLRAEPGSQKKHQTSEDYNRQLAAEAKEIKSLIAEFQADYKTAKIKTEKAQQRQEEAEDRQAAAEQLAQAQESRVTELEEKASSLSVEITTKEDRLSSQKETIAKNTTIIEGQVSDYNVRAREMKELQKEKAELERKSFSQMQELGKETVSGFDRICDIGGSVATKAEKDVRDSLERETTKEQPQNSEDTAAAVRTMHDLIGATMKAISRIGAEIKRLAAIIPDGRFHLLASNAQKAQILAMEADKETEIANVQAEAEKTVKEAENAKKEAIRQANEKTLAAQKAAKAAQTQEQAAKNEKKKYEDLTANLEQKIAEAKAEGRETGYKDGYSAGVSAEKANTQAKQNEHAKDIKDLKMKLKNAEGWNTFYKRTNPRLYNNGNENWNELTASKEWEFTFDERVSLFSGDAVVKMYKGHPVRIEIAESDQGDMIVWYNGTTKEECLQHLKTLTAKHSKGNGI